jgi:hypothetical protein
MEITAAIAIAIGAIVVGYILPDDGRSRFVITVIGVASIIGIIAAVTGV